MMPKTAYQIVKESTEEEFREIMGRVTIYLLFIGFTIGVICCSIGQAVLQQIK